MGRIVGRQVEDQTLEYNKLKHATLKRYAFDVFQNIPRASANTGHGAPVGTTGATNLLVTGQPPNGGNLYEYHIKGAGQTLVVPSFAATGLDISFDQADNEGVELSMGITSRSRHAHTVGTDPDSFTRVKLTVEDVSGSDDLCIGWRKAEAYQANVDDYDEGAWVNINAGDLVAETILNAAATVSTDSGRNLADAGAVTIEVRVQGRNVFFLSDGSQLPLVGSFQFDAGEVIVPFLFFLHATDLAGYVRLLEWEAGPMSCRVP